MDPRIPASFLEPEARPLVVERSVKRLWAVLLEMLLVFDDVCTRHGIRYSVDGGTMLGAERHGGFIPWDNDVDLIMLRADYEKLRALPPDVFPPPYFLQNEETDPEAARGHPQLRNSNTTAILESEMRQGRPLFRFNQGVFIDIFVFDILPDDPAEAAAFTRELSRMKQQILCLQNTLALPWRKILCRSPFGRTSLLKLRSALYAFFHKKPLIQHLQERFDRAARRYEHTAGARVSHLTFIPDPPPKLIFPRTVLDSLVRKPFEMLSLPVPTCAHAYLTQLYGDWRKHVVGASTHGGLLLDLDRPYTHYFSPACEA